MIPKMTNEIGEIDDDEFLEQFLINPFREKVVIVMGSF
jgi:hypothetical protein